MEVDDANSSESEYRLQITSKVKYLTIAPKTFDRDTLSFPLQALSTLDIPWHDEWTVAHISRDETNPNSDALKNSFSSRRLAGVRNKWHPTQINCLELTRIKLLTPMTFEAISPFHHPPTTIIAKIARFEWEIPRIERETRAYQLLEGEQGLAPRFLGHIHEGGRVMEILLEKVEGRGACLRDLKGCEAVLGRLHGLGMLHGDVNRFNFVVGGEGVRLVDFEGFREEERPDVLSREMESLRGELVEESGRGGGFIFQGDGS